MKTTLTITSSRVRVRSSGRDGKPILNGFNVFVDSNATDIATEWFNKNKVVEKEFELGDLASKAQVRGLNLKFGSWSRLSNAYEKINIRAIKAHFGSDCNVNFSMHTGCSMCPCSPGYRVRKVANAETLKKYGNHDIWVKIEASDAELAAAKLKEPKALVELDHEVTAFKEFIAQNAK